MQNGKSPPPPSSAEYKRIKAEFEKIKAVRAAEQASGAAPPSAQAQAPQRSTTAANDAARRQAEARFTVTQGLLIVFLGLVTILHVLGLYLFTSGFLLTRLILEDKSQCDAPPIPPAYANHALGTAQTGCWHPKSFDKAVVILIDALRYDFTVPFIPSREGESPHHYHDALRVLHETAVRSPQNALLLPFIADPPTTTLQRLKGLTTGTLPTLIDAGSNFAGTAIEEDNLLLQLRGAGKRIVHLGDDTWHALFPDVFEPGLTKPYDSFNVWDLHTLDNGVTEHLFPLLETGNTTQWDVLIGHYLGVDHAGHRYGPDHAAMNAKLRQMDEVLRRVIDELEEDTLLVVMGDHGMDAKGDHGGESDDEVEAALWMYSKRPVFGREKHESPAPPPTAKSGAVAQIDLVPTLALLLGLPIPFNNLGMPILQAFIGPQGKDYENVARASRMAAAQVVRHIREYSLARDIEEAFALPKQVWDVANHLWEVTDPRRTEKQKWQEVAVAYRTYQTETIAVCRALWARFDVPRMISGVVVLSIALVLLVLYARGISALRLALSPGFVKRGGIGLLAGAGTGAAVGYLVPAVSFSHATALLASLGASAGIANVFYKARKSVRFPLPTRIWSLVSLLFTLSLSAGFAANSFTIWEDEILLFFLSTLGVLFFLASMRLDSVVDRTWACYHAFVFTLLTRVASLSRLCREEQMPFCKSTFYASSTSSTSAWWQLLIPVGLAFVLPNVIKQYYVNTRSYHHSARLWLGVCFRGALALSAVYWILDALDNAEYFAPSMEGTIKTVKVMIAQVVLGLAIPVGYSVFAYAAPFVQVVTGPVDRPPAIPTLNSKDTAFLSQDGTQRIQILGYGNAHGSRFFLLPSMWALAILLLQKPMGAGAIALLLWQILSLAEILAANNLQDSAVGPITLALLGSFHFFKTGHQATLASIQWDAAFIPLKNIIYPFSPLLILLNTFGAQILCAIAVPTLVLWKRDPTRRGLLSDVAKATGTFISFFATESLATAVWAGHLRRHLMLYRVFSPRFMMAGLVMVVVDLCAVFIGLGGTRWGFLSLGEVFGVYGA